MTTPHSKHTDGASDKTSQDATSQHPTPNTLPPSKLPRIRISRTLLGILFVLFLFCGMLFGGHAVTVRAYSDRIYGGITIGGVAVGGMTITEATETLQRAVNTFLDEGVLVTLGDASATIPLAPQGASDPDLVYELAEVNVSRLIHEAYAVGRSSEPLTNFFLPLWYATLGTKNISPEVSFAETRLTDALRTSFPYAESPGTPTDFVVSIVNDTVSVEVIEAVVGATIDTQTALQTLTKDAQDFSLAPLNIRLIERSSIISASDAQSLIPAAEHALERAPYTLTFTNDLQKELSYEISQKNLAIWLKPEVNEQGAPQLGLDSESMRAFLTDIHTAIDLAPQDARFTVTDNRVSDFLPSRDGLVVDDDQLFTDLRAEFAQDTVPANPISIAVVRKEPAVPVAQANTYGITEALGVGYSSFAGSPANRRANIAHGAEKLNGLLIAPGETLSLLEHLRPFTTADGYLPELVIKGDEIIPEIGGGLCQIGTTTFRAALNSGLKILERRNHSLVVSYYNDPANGNPGTDATIYDPSPDLKIQNDTANYIMLATQVDTATSELFFTFWGTSDGRKGSYTPPQVLSWTGYGPAIIKETTTLSPGTEKCQSPHPGATTSFDYTIVWADGSVTTETFTSSYRALPQVCLVGVLENPEPETAPELVTE